MTDGNPLKGKKQVRRKKTAPPSAKSVLPFQPQAKPRFQAEYLEKYPNLGVVHEGEIRQFVSTLPISQLRAYGARFFALLEALEAARQPSSAKTARTLSKLIAELKSESRNHRYRQLLQAIAEAVETERGISRAVWTVLRVVEMTFEWAQEYLLAFRLYRMGLAELRQSGGSTPETRQPKK